MGARSSRQRPVLLPNEVGEHLLLVRPQRVARADPFGDLIAKQDRRAFTIVIAEVRTVLGIANECREARRKGPGHLRRLGEPLVLVGLEPSKTVADDRSAPDLVA